MPPGDDAGNTGGAGAGQDADNADDTANQQGDDTQDDEDDEESVDGLKSALEKERDARKKAQKALRDLKRTGSSAGRQQSGSAAGGGQGNQNGNQQGDSPETARLRTELETYKATAEKAQRDNLNREMRDQARIAAKAIGAVDPDAVARMVTLDDIDVTDDGKPDGVDDAVRDLKKAHPALFGRRATGSGDGGTGGGGSNGGGASKDVGIGVSRLRHAYAESSKPTR